MSDSLADDRMVENSHSFSRLSRGTYWFESRNVGAALLAFSWVSVAILYFVAQSDTTYGVDEFDWISRAGSIPARDFLDPVNGHLMVVPMLIFRAGLELFDNSNVGFIVLELLVLYSLSLGIFVYSRPKIGPVLAVAPAVIPLTLGAAWPLLSASLIGIQWGIAASFGLWAFILIERERSGGRGFAKDGLACVLLCLSIASFSIGFPFIVACGALILLRPSRLRSLWIVAVPVALYFLWRLWAASKVGSAGAEIANVPWIPGYIVDSFLAGVSAIAGFNIPYGPWTSLKLQGFDLGRLLQAFALTICTGVAIVAAFRHRARERTGWLPILAILLLPLTLWASQGLLLEEFRRPMESRYLFGSAIVILLVVVELFRGVKVTQALAIAVLSLTLASTLMGAAKFKDGRTALMPVAQESSAIMSAFDIAGDNADPTFVVSSEPVSPQSQFIFLQAGPYLEMARRFDTPAYSEREVMDAPSSIREIVDRTLVAVSRIDVQPAKSSQRVTCRQVQIRPGEDSILSKPGFGETFLRSPIDRQLFLGRFAEGEPVEITPLDAGKLVSLRLPADGSARQWRLRAAGDAPIALCSKA